MAIVGPPPRWLVPVLGRGGRGGAGVREGEKAASDSNSPLLALSDSPLRITLGDPRVGEVRGREVRSFLSQIEGSVWSVRSRA